MARQLGATALLCLLSAPAAAADVAWPPNWAVEHGGERARPDDARRDVTLDLFHRADPPAPALDAALRTFMNGSRSAGYDAGCGNAAPVRLGAGNGTGAGCTATRNGLPLVKASFVAWAVPGGSAVLVFAAPPGAYETYLPALAATLATARTP